MGDPGGDPNSNSRVGLITRVVITNYKSIAACDVALRPLTFLGGMNGSGKSNFLDGLRFIADSLRTSLDHALRDRGGIKEVRRRSAGRPTHFGMRVEFTLGHGTNGTMPSRSAPAHKGATRSRARNAGLGNRRLRVESRSSAS